MFWYSPKNLKNWVSNLNRTPLRKIVHPATYRSKLAHVASRGRGVIFAAASPSRSSSWRHPYSHRHPIGATLTRTLNRIFSDEDTNNIGL
jgi:hypothetical protein